MPQDYRRAAPQYEPEPAPDAEPDGPSCPGTCNAAWRAAEKRRLDRGTTHELVYRAGLPVWCTACATSIRGTLTDWPELATLLTEEIESGVSAGMSEYVSGSKEAPVHDHEAPSMLLDEVAEFLSAWENTIRDQRHLPGRRGPDNDGRIVEWRWSAEHGDRGRDPHRDPARTITLASVFLATHLDWVLRERPPGEETVAEDYGQMLLDYHRRAQRLTGTGKSEPLRVLGVACPNCDRCSLEHELEPAANRRGRLVSFVYDAAGQVAVHLFPRRLGPDGLPERAAAQKVTEETTKPLEGAVTGYIACRRCKPVFRMTPDEYQRWLKQLAHDACTRGMATREKLAVVFGGDIPTEYAKALPPVQPGPDAEDAPGPSAPRFRPSGQVGNRFDPHLFDDQVGRPVRVKVPGEPGKIVERILKAAVVSEDGTNVQLTFEPGAGE
jgi:hypothetical protein